MANVGYIRVSTVDQETGRQLENIVLDKVFEEKISSAVPNRPILAECLNYLREGDVFWVHSIDRLARNLIELQSIVSSLVDKGVEVRFYTENLTFSKGSSPMQELMLQVLGAFAQFERKLIRERQQEGINNAKRQGKHLGRPKKLSEEDKKLILEMYKDGCLPAFIADRFDVSLSSVYKLIRKNKI